MKKAERLAIELIANPMTLDEIHQWHRDTFGTIVSSNYLKSIVTDMRATVLPDLDALCPRPTYEGDYRYVVIDSKPDVDSAEHMIQRRGARVMAKDNKQRLVTMVRTSRPYAEMLDGRTVEGKLAEAYTKYAEAALAVVEAIELGQQP